MIEDIKFFKDQVYMLKTSKITSEDIERKLGSITYSGQGKPIDKKVENSNIPYFSIAFFYYVFENDAIPNEKELFTTYLDINGITESNNFLTIDNEDYNKEGIKSRMLRSYPSLIRDFHFFKLCRESGKFEDVKYSTRKDISEGVDLLIAHEGFKFCIATYVKTKRAMQFKKKKNRTRHNYATCHMQIELRIDLSKTNEKIKKVSNIILLSNAYISELEDKINLYVRSNR